MFIQKHHALCLLAASLCAGTHAAGIIRHSDEIPVFKKSDARWYNSICNSKKELVNGKPTLTHELELGRKRILKLMSDGKLDFITRNVTRVQDNGKIKSAWRQASSLYNPGESVTILTEAFEDPVDKKYVNDYFKLEGIGSTGEYETRYVMKSDAVDPQHARLHTFLEFSSLPRNEQKQSGTWARITQKNMARVHSQLNEMRILANLPTAQEVGAAQDLELLAAQAAGNKEEHRRAEMNAAFMKGSMNAAWNRQPNTVGGATASE